MSARMVRLIVTEIERRGQGQTLEDPVRIVRQYWDLDGTLLAEVDAHAGPDFPPPKDQHYD